MRHPLHLEGRLEAFTDGIDDALLTDMSQMEMYLYAWISGDRGTGTSVEFPSTGPYKQCMGATQGGNMLGTFRLTMDLDEDGVSELLKLQGAVRLTDFESFSKRTMTVATGAACLDQLLKGLTVSCEIRDPFTPGNFMKVSLHARNAGDYANCETGEGLSAASMSMDRPRIPIRPTALRNMGGYCAAIKGLGQELKSGVDANRIEIPPGGEMFMTGLTSWEFGGCVLSDGVRVDALSTHYAVMGAQELCLKRAIPAAIPLYSLFLTLSHSGLTMQQVLQAPLLEQATHFLSGVSCNFDAAGDVYARDTALRVSLSVSQGLGITQQTTENMALPCGAPQFLGRTFLASDPIHIPPHASPDELAKLLCGRQENVRSILTDDCESFAYLAVMCLKSLADAARQTRDLRTLSAGFEHLFQRWGDEDWQGLGKYVHKMLGLVESGALTLSTVVGLATNASAGEDGQPAPGSLNGHCHNVGRLAVPGQEVQCFIVEGTAPMALCKVTAGSPRVTCQVVTEAPGGAPCVSVERLPMPEFLTRLGKTVSVMTQVINAPYGPQTCSQGWPLPEPMTGWLASTIFSNTLDSDRDCPLKFYHRVMFTGWSCAQGGSGCLPVQEGDAGRTAGCHPYDLNNVDLRAMSLGLPAETRAHMSAILDEATPPIADLDTFQRLTRTWSPAQPLADMNRAGQEGLEPGVQYVTVSCMESAASQDYDPVILRLKEPFIREWDRLNRLDPKSDGIRLSVEALGTGTTVKLRVPQRDIHELTVVRNGIQALQSLGWKGYIPSGG